MNSLLRCVYSICLTLLSVVLSSAMATTHAHLPADLRGLTPDIKCSLYCQGVSQPHLSLVQAFLGRFHFSSLSSSLVLGVFVLFTVPFSAILSPSVCLSVLLSPPTSVCLCYSLPSVCLCYPPPPPVCLSVTLPHRLCVCVTLFPTVCVCVLHSPPPSVLSLIHI